MFIWEQETCIQMHAAVWVNGSTVASVVWCSYVFYSCDLNADLTND